MTESDGPPTWLTVAVFTLVCRKCLKLTENEHLLMAGHVLDIDWQEMVRLIRWHEGYMTFHEGGAHTVLEGVYE